MPLTRRADGAIDRFRATGVDVARTVSCSSPAVQFPVEHLPIVGSPPRLALMRSVVLHTAVAAGQRVVRWVASTVMGAHVFARVLHRIDGFIFRLSDGSKTATSALAGLPVIMLTTTGSRSALARTVPVLGFPIDGQIAVAAGNFGRAREPGWCLNLRRDPHARISVHGQLRDVVAQEMAGKERERIWQQALAIYPGGSAYAKRAKNRTIAVFLLRDQISDTSAVRPPAPQQ
jgi:deazaflavin-dependent oxidoreductase (nitroreductase family)